MDNDLGWWFDLDDPNHAPFQHDGNDGMIWQMCAGPFMSRQTALIAQGRRFGYETLLREVMQVRREIAYFASFAGE